MEQPVDIIQQIIEEHKVIGKGFESLETTANDALALVGLEKAKGTLVPGRFDQKAGLQSLRESLDSVEKGLRAHFEREETLLLAAFRKHGGEELVSALNTLLMEHKDLLGRFEQCQKDIAGLQKGGMSRHLWEASANDMKAHIAHTRKLLMAHAEIEQELLHRLKAQMQEK